MRGGPSLKVKGGLVGFRRSLKAKGGLVGFRRSLKAKGGLVGFRKKTYNPLAFTQKTLIFAQN